MLVPFASAAAQDTTRGVRIGLTYDPGTRPGIVVLPIRGAAGDSLEAILERDFRLSDRFSVLELAGSPGAGTMPNGSLNYQFFGTMGAPEKGIGNSGLSLRRSRVPVKAPRDRLRPVRPRPGAH